MSEDTEEIDLGEGQLHFIDGKVIWKSFSKKVAVEFTDFSD